MSFQIIKAETRTQRLIEWFSGICPSITDFVVGSKIRSKFETIAVEMEAQDFAWYQTVKKAIPIAIYRAFDFNLLPAQKASGKAVFYLAEPLAADVTIPAGTQMATATSESQPEKLYTTTATVTIQAGQITAESNIIAESPGEVGNTASDTVTVLKSAINGVDSVNNPTPVSGGAERETEDERRIRFIEYVNTLTRGTTAAVVYGAKTATVKNLDGDVIESVRDAVVYEPFMHDNSQPVGIFFVYIYSDAGTTSDSIIAEAQKVIDGYTSADGTKIPGWKAAGVICNVAKATEIITDITASVIAFTGYDTAILKETVTAACDEYVGSLGIGKAFIYNELVQRIMEIDGVYNCQITAPSSDKTPLFNEVYVSGAKTITVAES